MAECIDRERIIRERLKAEEALAGMLKAEIRKNVLETLIGEKGYLEEDIEVDRPFAVFSGGNAESVSVDFIVRLEGKRLIAIKCVPAALESRERHILAFGRSADARVIPLSVVTNGSYARVLDTETGRLIAEDFGAVPSKGDALETFRGVEMKRHPEEKLVMERRILLAFECIACSITDP